MTTITDDPGVVNGARWGRAAPWWGRVLRNQPNAFTALAVANVIASFADNDGRAWPSQATIAKVLGISRASIDRAIRTLSDDAVGILGIRRRRRTSNEYTLHFDASNPEASQPGQDSSLAATSTAVLMPQSGTLDASPVEAQDASPVEAQTDQLTDHIEHDDDAREKNQEKDDSPADVISKLRDIGLTGKQAEKAIRDHPVAAKAWAEVGLSGVPRDAKPPIRNHTGFIVSMIYRDQLPPSSSDRFSKMTQDKRPCGRCRVPCQSEKLVASADPLYSLGLICGDCAEKEPKIIERRVALAS